MKHGILECSYCTLVFNYPINEMYTRIRHDKITYENRIICPECERKEQLNKLVTNSEQVPW